MMMHAQVFGILFKTFVRRFQIVSSCQKLVTTDKVSSKISDFLFEQQARTQKLLI